MRSGMRGIGLLAAFTVGGVVAGVLPGAAHAGSALPPSSTVIINFENQPLTTSGSLNSLKLTADGVSVLTVALPQSFQVVDLSPLGLSGAAGFGTRTIEPFDANHSIPFVVNFSKPVSSFSVQIGDIAGQTDPLSLQAFSGTGATGTLLGTQTGSLTPAAGTFGVSTLQISAAGIRSVSFIGGPAGTDNGFYDNFSVTIGSGAAVPLPTAALAFPLGAAVALWGYRRMRAGAEA